VSRVQEAGLELVEDAAGASGPAPAIEAGGAAHDTIVDPAAAPTLIDSPSSFEPGERTEPGAAKTEEWPAAPEAADPGVARVTEPGPARFVDEPRAELVRNERAVRQGRVLFWAGLAVALLIATVVAAWWVLGALLRVARAQ
jgi:hypothetical protein